MKSKELAVTLNAIESATWIAQRDVTEDATWVETLTGRNISIGNAMWSEIHIARDEFLNEI